eukprot:1159560-Pelagomonas_calceolata.AAC.2
MGYGSGAQGRRRRSGNLMLSATQRACIMARILRLWLNSIHQMTYFSCPTSASSPQSKCFPCATPLSHQVSFAQLRSSCHVNVARLPLLHTEDLMRKRRIHTAVEVTRELRGTANEQTHMEPVDGSVLHAQGSHAAASTILVHDQVHCKVFHCRTQNTEAVDSNEQRQDVSKVMQAGAHEGSVLHAHGSHAST